MKRIEINMGRTLNTGNYESFKISYTVALEGNFTHKDLTKEAEKLYEVLERDSEYFKKKVEESKIPQRFRKKKSEE